MGTAKTFQNWTLEQIALSKAYGNKISILWLDMLHYTVEQFLIAATNRWRGELGFRFCLYENLQHAEEKNPDLCGVCCCNDFKEA